MSYIALYRKYRSQSFGELMGQDSVTTVLQNSLRSGRIAHAYLFYGARGCGKTSTARLLSRALNCEAQDGPTPEPCGVCRLCVAIREGACMDVIEIDAASETGVENVREKIIENVQYVPTEARYKVYIIDEVHDLSAKAFDALLKTLEEPPPHVVFVLATTEQHKVPITIRSRCIPFQFKRGTLADLSSAIERVVVAEGYNAEPEAIRAIARCAEGSWRDALSLLEQVISYSDLKITEKTVQDALGAVGSETLGRVVQTIGKDSWSETLLIGAELIESGKDVRQLFSALSGFLRDLLLIASGASNTAALELGADRLDQLTPLASIFTPKLLLKMLSTLSAAEKETRVNNQQRWLLERTLCSLMPCNLSVEPTTQQLASPVRQQQEAERHARPLERTYTPTAPKPIQLPDQGEDPTASLETQRASVAPAESQPETRFAGEVTLEVVKRSWPRVLKLIAAVSPSAQNFLSKAEAVELNQKVVILRFSEDYAKDRIMLKARELVEKKMNEALQTEGYRIRPFAEVLNVFGTTPASMESGSNDRPSASNDSRGADSDASASIGQTSLLDETLEMFGGEVIRTEISKES